MEQCFSSVDCAKDGGLSCYEKPMLALHEHQWIINQDGNSHGPLRLGILSIDKVARPSKWMKHAKH